MIVVEYKKKKKSLEIHFDGEGLADLQKFLAEARSSGHVHLASPAWAGTELSKEKQNMDPNDQIEVLNMMTFRYAK